MAIVNSNNYYTGVVPESSRNTQVKDLTTGKIFPDVLEWNFEPMTVDKPQKEKNLAESSDRTVITANKVTATMSGNLTDAHEILLQLLFDDASSPYLFASTIPTTKSANFYQLFLNANGTVASYDVILGAVITQFEMTGDANGLWTYTATIEGTSYRQQITNTGGDVLSNIPSLAGTVFQFGNTTCLLYTSKTALNSANVTITKSMVDDKLRFQNSMSMANDRYIGVGGTISFETLWDNSADAGGQAKKYDVTAKANTITLVNASKSWAVLTYGILTEHSRPDADRAEFLASDTLKLVYSGANNPVQITVS